MWKSISQEIKKGLEKVEEIHEESGKGQETYDLLLVLLVSGGTRLSVL